MFAFRYPAVVILSFVIAGMLAGRHVNPGLPALLAIMALAVMAAIYVYHRLPPGYFVFPLAVVALAGAGMISAARYQVLRPDDISRFATSGEKLRLFGEVVRWPEIKRGKTILACRIDSAVTDRSIVTTSGLIALSIRRETTQFALGDRISFVGRLYRPQAAAYPQRFDYGEYLADKGFRGLVYIDDPIRIDVSLAGHTFFGGIINRIREWILASFRAHLSEGSAALASGFLIGETHDIPEGVYQAFRRTGTLHLLAVSGSNVAMVLIVVVWLLRWVPLGRIIRLGLLIGVIIIFSHLSYNQPSVIRASIMAALMLIGRALYRRADLNNIIATAAVVLILYDPGNLFDIGFQLSFVVTWALVLFLPEFNRWFASVRLSRMVTYVLLVASSSIVAALVSAPITLHYFGQTSLVTAASNLVVVPLVSVVVVGLVILIVMQLIMPAAAAWLGAIIDWVLSLTYAAVEWFSRGEVELRSLSTISGWGALALLIGVVCLLAAVTRKRIRPAALMAVLACAGIYVATDLLPARKVGDLELINAGGWQSVVGNQGSGLAVFHPGREHGDAFALEFYPMLLGRRGEKPLQFLFLEPRYRTEFRLEQMSQEGEEIPFQPVGTPAEMTGPSVWTNGRSLSSGANDSDYVITCHPGMAIIRTSDGRRLVIADSLRSALNLSGADRDSTTWFFLMAKDDSDLVALAGANDIRPAWVFLEKSRISYNVLRDSALELSWRRAGIDLVEVGASRRLDMPRPD